MKRPTQRNAIPIIGLILLLFSGVRQDAATHDLFLIEAESPYIRNAWNIEIIPQVSYETGAIPTFVIKPHAGVSLFNIVQLEASPSMGVFTDTSDFMFTEWEASARVRIPLSLLGIENPTLYAYAGVHHTFAEPYTVQYQGDLPLVHTVLSEHTDRGLDLTVGLLSMISLHIGPVNGGLILSGEYARTTLRDYNPSFDGEGYKNRIRLHASPVVFFTIQPLNNLNLTVTLQNRFAIWFDRGFMYNLLPQVTIPIIPAVSIFTGVSLPMVGGGVVKFFVGSRISIQPGREIKREIRIELAGLHFPPDRAILYGPENERSEQNRIIIEDAFRKLQQYPGYSIDVEGHTSFVYWDDPVKGPVEQEEVLIPLSNARAHAVLEALAELGIARTRMTAIGKGGSEPKVPFSKKAEQWKNRRVELVLHK